MDRNITMKQQHTFIILFACYLCCISCEKEEKDPIYQGKWVFESAVPAIDKNYNSSYIHIYADRSFELFDSSRELLIHGTPSHFNLSRNTLRLIDPETDEIYTFYIQSRKQDLLVLKTTISDIETKITLRKII